MTLPDANILLYAYNTDAPEQAAAAAWLDELLASGETIGLPWITVWAFLRIGTSARIWPSPLAPERAFAIIEAWLGQPDVVPVGPGARHGEILRRLVTGHRAVGPLVTDAVLAALAMEYGATLASTDQDFRRFPNVRWVNPFAAS
ncbi:MAG: PIN domain-containing protein [Bryobacterales bacterium]|nr:PIN domain-containing protein [Bryobacterales bacterium]